jgi:glycerophosphoryl diester phosphodiesterase
VHSAASNHNVVNTCVVEEQEIKVYSHSFNAKERSGFTINGSTEHVSRGLTVVHFIDASEYEFRTYDTYGSTEEASKFVEILTLLEQEKAVYMILAHDSAAKSLSNFSEKLLSLGFNVLSALKSRQAYIMHNINGSKEEVVDALSVRTTLEIPAMHVAQNRHFEAPVWEFEPSNDRYIAHAAGEVNGTKSTNTKEALDENYAKGFRYFELDIIETKDGALVAAHDWNMWSRFTDYTGSLPVTLQEFNKHKIYGKYTTLDMDGINKWFSAHPDAILVTDKLNDPISFASQFIDKERLIMELFSPLAIEEAGKEGINTMISQEPFLAIKGDKLTYLKVNKIKYVAISRRIIARHMKLLQQLNEAGIRVYVYNVNFDPGKDEKYVLKNEIGLVYGMYADKWVFDPQNPE